MSVGKMTYQRDNYSEVVDFFKNDGVGTQEAIKLANRAGGRRVLDPIPVEQALDMARDILEDYNESIPFWFDLIDFD
jgi:hypothetical protein